MYTVDLLSCSARQPAVCSQKSRQSKEKLQEVACCGGKLLEDVEAVKEGRLMPTAVPLDRPWLER